MYVDQAYYTSLGYPTLESNLFNRLNVRAQAKIDRLTQNRIASMQSVSTMVKDCICELINLLNKKEAEGVALQSFNNDGYSESYAEPLTEENIEKAVGVIVLDYLANEKDDNGTPLLWLGIDEECE